MQMVRRLILGGILSLVFSGMALAQSLSGSYKAEGRNPDGSAYSGSVTIVDIGGTVGMTWRIGSTSYKGKGALDGRVLTVNWGDDAPVIYVVMPNGVLYGTWAKGRALERLLPE